MECLEIMKKYLPNNHPDICDSMQYLATNLSRQKKFEEAYLIQKENHEMKKLIYPKNHPLICFSMVNLGIMLSQL
jgi:hypothetical protein